MKGFTLVELLVTFAIAAILVALAIPGYQKSIVNSRSQAVGTSIIAALRLARSEAITRSTNVQVCPLDAGQTACAAGSNDWQYGWRVWVPNGDIIQDYPINLSGYVSYCCTGNLEYTPTGVPVKLDCNCSSISFLLPNGKTASFNYAAYFQIKPTNCTNVYMINIDTIGRPSLNTGVSCQ